MDLKKEFEEKFTDYYEDDEEFEEGVSNLQWNGYAFNNPRKVWQWIEQKLEPQTAKAVGVDALVSGKFAGGFRVKYRGRVYNDAAIKSNGTIEIYTNTGSIYTAVNKIELLRIT